MVTHRVLVIGRLHDVAMELLDARSDVEFEVIDEPSEERLLAGVDGVDAITIRASLLPASVVEAADRLRVISRHGVGYDNIPIEACTARGIPVTLVGGVNAVSVAEQTMLLMLAAARCAVELDTAVRHGDFSIRSRVLGVELRGRTLVIVGYGRIGREVARRASAFGMRVCVVDPNVTAVDGDLEGYIELVADLAEALVRADVLSLHVPLVAGTRNLVGPRELASMPSGSILINASRGGLVDEAALLHSVRTGHLRGAGLDTFVDEPLPADSPLLAEPRIVLSPHSAALTEESMLAMGVATVQNALAGIDGTLDPALVVNPSTLPASRSVHENGQPPS